MQRNSVWLVQLLLGSLAVAILGLRSFSEYSYQKDVQAIYLSAVALRQGEDMLTPVQELASRYWSGRSGSSPLPNHLPPVLTLLFVPMTFVPFPVFTTIWLLLNLSLLFFSARALGLSWPPAIALAAWPPAFWVLDNGNLEIVILALMILSWKAARTGFDGRAGVWLGVASVVKFYPLLFLLPFVVRRRMRVVGAALLAGATGQVVNLAVLGASRALFYYADVLPRGSALWTRLGLNSAPYGALLRLFGGAEDVGPVLEWRWVIYPALGAIAVLAAVAFYRLEPEDAPAAALIALPNVRGYVAVLLLPAMVRLLRDTTRRRQAALACACASLTLPVVNILIGLVRFVFDSPAGALSPLAALLTAIQAMGTIGMVLLALRVSSKHRVRGSAADQ